MSQSGNPLDGCESGRWRLRLSQIQELAEHPLTGHGVRTDLPEAVPRPDDRDVRASRAFRT